MTGSPLASEVLFHVGPVPIAVSVVRTWAVMAGLVAVSALVTRRLSVTAPRWPQAVAELLVETLESQIRSTMEVEPRPFLPLIGTIFVFILAANLSSLVPGMEPPTAALETDAALALIVLAAVVAYGVRAHGPLGYLRSFAQPTPLMFPINVLEVLTRAVSMTVRLFGNIMSGVFVIGIMLSLAGFLVPVPFMALEVLTGLIQAYIFTVLSMVFIGGAIANEEA